MINAQFCEANNVSKIRDMIQRSREEFESDQKNQIEEAKALSMQENKLFVPEELKAPD